MSEEASPHQSVAARSASSSEPALAGGHPRRIALFLAMTLLILAADLGLKALAFRHVADQPVRLLSDPDADVLMRDHEPVTVLPGILSLKLTTNEGAVFGMGQGQRWLFVVVSILATGVLLRIFWRSPRNAHLLHLAVAMVLAGALGNLYDRVVYGMVRDMLWLFPGSRLPFGLTWPGGDARLYPWVFNLADVALVVGVIALVGITWLRELRQPADQKADG